MSQSRLVKNNKLKELIKKAKNLLDVLVHTKKSLTEEHFYSLNTKKYADKSKIQSKMQPFMSLRENKGTESDAPSIHGEKNIQKQDDSCTYAGWLNLCTDLKNMHENISELELLAHTDELFSTRLQEKQNTLNEIADKINKYVEYFKKMDFTFKQKQAMNLDKLEETAKKAKTVEVPKEITEENKLQAAENNAKIEENAATKKSAGEAKKTEETIKAEEETIKAEETKKAEEAKKAEDARKAEEETRIAEEKTRKAEETKKAEEAKNAEDARKAEDDRKAEETKNTQEAFLTGFEVNSKNNVADSERNVKEIIHETKKIKICEKETEKKAEKNNPLSQSFDFIDKLKEILNTIFSTDSNNKLKRHSGLAKMHKILNKPNKLNKYDTDSDKNKIFEQLKIVAEQRRSNALIRWSSNFNIQRIGMLGRDKNVNDLYKFLMKATTYNGINTVTIIEDGSRKNKKEKLVSGSEIIENLKALIENLKQEPDKKNNL